MGKTVKKIVHAVVNPISFFVPKIFPSTEKLLNPVALAESLVKDPLATIREIGPAAAAALSLSAGAPPTFVPSEPPVEGATPDPFSFLRFLLPGAPGLPGVPSGQISTADFVKAAVETAVQLAGVRGAIDTSVGGRLERLAGHQGTLTEQLARLFFPESKAQSAALGGLLQSVLGLVFPEMARSRAGWEHLIFGQFPAFGATATQSARYGGVRKDTVQLAARKKWVPPEWAKARGFHNPDFEPESALGLTGFEDLVFDEGWGAFGTMVTAQAGELLTDSISGIGDAAMRGLIGFLRPLVQAGLDIGGFVGGQVRTLAEETFGVAGQKILGGVADRLTAFGPVPPGGQEEVVKAALGSAFTLGLGAHVVASVAELVMPLKHLGLPQLAAFMVDLAGFGAIAGAEVRPLVKWGIDVPADYAARRQFSSQLPSVGEAKQFVLERHIDLETYAEVLRFHGYSEFWVDQFLKEVWEEPSLREITVIMDDTPVDEGWLQKKVAETGLEDKDVVRTVEALQRRANRTVRQGYIASLHTTYRDGQLSDDELERELRRLNLNEEARDLIVRRAALERRRELAELWERAWRDLALEEVVTLDDYRLALQGLAFQEDRAAVLVAMVEAKRTSRFAREERADIKATVREEQRLRVQLAQEEFRRRRIDSEDLDFIFRQLGIEPQQAAAMVALEAVRRDPVPRAPVVLSPEAQREQENRVIQEATLTALREGKIKEAQAQRVLLSLSLPARQVEALLSLELARIAKPKPAVVKEDPAAVTARQLKTEAAVQEFRLKKISEEMLRQRLRAAGHPAMVVEGFVERELARVPPPAPPAPPAAPKESAEERQRLTILTEAAKELFRQGILTQPDLVNLLENLGHPTETAEAIATLEAIRAQRKTNPAA